MFQTNETGSLTITTPTNYVSGANIRKWKAAMDWTQLRELELVQFDNVFFDVMKHELPNVNSLKLVDAHRCADMTETLLSFNPLSSLSTTGCSTTIDWTKVLEYHCSSLNRLQIRERVFDKDFPIQNFSEICPGLVELDIDVSTDPMKVFNMLDQIAGYKNFTKLGLRLRPNEEEQFYSSFSYMISQEDPDVDKPIVLDSKLILKMFKQLKSSKQGEEFRELNVFVGNYDRHDMYYNDMEGAGHPQGEAQKYVCSVYNEDGNEKEEGEAWCESKVRYNDRHTISSEDE